jgi:hypothetical protein
LSASILAIVVAVGEASNPATVALRASAQESLGPETSILLVETVEPTNAQSLRVQRELGAGAVVLLVWREAAHLHALLHLHVANANRWITREIGFSSRDKLDERGRTLGFTIGSVWPQTQTGARSPPEAKSPVEKRKAEAPTEDTPSTVLLPPAVKVTRAVPPREVGPAPAPSAGVAARAEMLLFRPIRIGISALGAMGIGGPANGLGGGAESELFLTRDFGFRIGASVRVGSISELPGRDLVSSLTAGLEWWPLPISSDRRMGFGLRADALALHHQVSATTAGQAESQGRFLLGADLLVVVALRLTSRVEFVAGVGSEMAFGTTEIRTGSTHQTVATIPALREIAEAGIRLGF